MPSKSAGFLGGLPIHWNTFLDTPPGEADPDEARVVVVPVPYDSTTSFKGGARDGPGAIIRASRHLEDYDLELDRDISQVGIHTTPELVPDLSGPKALVEQVRRAVLQVVSRRKVPVLLGGEHTIAIGAVKALVEAEAGPGMSVLYLDAHADLRDKFMGTRWGHASVARRLLEVCPVVHVGVRSLSSKERQFIRQEWLPVQFWSGEAGGMADLAAAVLESLSESVYVSIDLDVFDPSLIPAVGTPEPGGMSWAEVTGLLKAIGERRQIVGFDVAELSPSEGPVACAVIAAKLAYKLMGYATGT